MKTFIIVCLAALAAAAPDADAKADPWLTYSNYYTGYPYNTYGAGFPYRANYYNYRSPVAYTTYGKREAEPAADAEADPKADPWVAYSGLHYPLAYNGLHNTIAYNGLHHPLTYGVGYPYTYPVVKKVVEKDAEKTDEAEVEPAKVTVPLVYGAGYPYSHYPYNYNYVHHSIGKREAEPAAEADPWTLYSNYYNGYRAGYPYYNTYAGLRPYAAHPAYTYGRVYGR